MVTTSCGHSARGGSGRRNTSSSASEQRPAITVRNAVSAIGSIADTAMRVAGKRAAEDRDADKTQQQTETFA